VTRRDNDATWQAIGAYCRERGWSKQRAIWEIQEGGLIVRTMPPGHEHEIDWHGIWTASQFNLETSTVNPVGRDLLAVEIEVMPAADVAPIEAPMAAASPLRKNVSEAALRNCILAIQTERPNDPPDEDDFWKMVESRLGATIPRDRIRQARDDVAPEYKLSPGRPRKSAQ
jgi:hypothetical protein